MKRWQVVVTTHSLLGVTGPFERVRGEYRWRWLADLNAWLWNTTPAFLALSNACVRRKPVELRVVK